MSDEQRRDRDGDPFRESIRTVSGILGALKDAIEETFDDLRERGDISPDRAREAARTTVRRAQEQFDEMRDRLDFVPRREFEELRTRLDALEARLDAHTGSSTAAHAAGASPGGGASPANPAGAAGAPGDGTPTSGRGFPVDEG